MPNPIFYTIASKDIIVGEASYNEHDLALVYDVSIEAGTNFEPTLLADSIDVGLRISRSEDVLITVDMMTLVFDGAKFCLKSLDAYTNKALWKVSSKKVPIITNKGLLVVDPVSLENSEGTVDIELKYEFSPNFNWVRIRWLDEDSANFIQVGSNMIVGLHNTMISDIYLLNVKYN